MYRASEMKTNADSSIEETRDNVAIRMVCGALGFLFGAVGVAQICSSLSSTNGWSELIGGITIGSYAFTYKRSEDTIFRASKKRVAGVLAISVLPPLILLFCFGDRTGWASWLVTYFLLSLSLGPVLLLWRYRQAPQAEPRDEGKLG